MHNQHDIGKKCFGVYLGTVIQHMTHGQVKVYIQGIYPPEWESKPDLLPICRQVVPQFAGSHDGNGVFSYPNLGATVVCMFANGDQNLPIMIGTMLGGPNAFGQYEHIKTNDEISSTRHLITAGKSHVEMYESGKISAIVVDPIRTSADVDYGSEVVSPLSIDAVTSRPICKQVDSEEISSIDCQHVLDNFYGHGTISASTHWYDPTAYTNFTILSAEQQQITENKTGEKCVDSYYVVDNDGKRHFGHKKKFKSTDISNVIDIANSANTNQLTQVTDKVDTSFKHDLDGENAVNMTSSNTDIYNYTYYNNNTKETILSNHNIKTNGKSNYRTKVDSSFDLMGETDQKLVDTYINSTTKDAKTRNLKSLNHSSIHANGKNTITTTALSSSKLTEMDAKIELQHMNKHDAQTVVKQGTNDGFLVDSTWNDDDTQVFGGTTTQLKQKNYINCDMTSGKDPSFEVKTQKKYTKTIDSTIEEYHVYCEEVISPTSGEISMQITDKRTKMGCTFKMDSNGNMTIDATTSISISAPSVTITGQTMTQSFKSLTQVAQMMLIKGVSGDCKIKNVSLLNHKHQETQAGDVVGPQPTKIATQSN